MRYINAVYSYCRQIPDAGGTTWFNNMYMACNSLSEGMKNLIAGIEVVNDLFGQGPGTQSRALRP